MSCDLKEIELLGTGGFGAVKKVKRGKDEYAFKILMDGIEYSIKEIDVLFRIANPSILKGYQLRFYDRDLDCQKLYLYEKNDDDDSNPYDPSNPVNVMKKGKVALLEELADKDMNRRNFFRFGKKKFDKKGYFDFNVELQRKCIFQICKAVECLMRAGYYHADIKPENMLYKIEGKKDKEDVDNIDDVNFYLSDYGILIELDENGYPTKKCLQGTPSYMAPETLVYDVVTYNSCMWAIGFSLLKVILDISFDGYRTRKILDDPMAYIDFINKKIKNEVKMEKNKYRGREYSKYISTLELLEDMAIVKESKRLSIFQVFDRLPEFSLPKCLYSLDPIKVVGAEAIEIFREYVKFFKIVNKRPHLKVFCLSFTYLLRLAAKGFNWRIDKNIVFSAVHAVATTFYFPQLYKRFTENEKNFVLLYVFELQGKVYTNDIYFNATNPEEIYTILNLLKQGRGEFFMHHFNSGFKKVYKNEFKDKKDIIFDPYRF